MLRLMLVAFTLFAASMAHANGGTAQPNTTTGRAWKLGVTLERGTVVTLHSAYGPSQTQHVHLVAQTKLRVVSNNGQGHLEMFLRGHGDPLRTSPIQAITLVHDGHLAQSVHLDRAAFADPAALRERIGAFAGQSFNTVFVPSEAAALFQ